MNNRLISHPSDFRYDPDNLLNVASAHLCAKNDAALARALDVMPPVISKIRHRHACISAFMLIRIHEKTRISIERLRELMGDRRPYYTAALPLSHAAEPGARAIKLPLVGTSDYG